MALRLPIGPGGAATKTFGSLPIILAPLSSWNRGEATFLAPGALGSEAAEGNGMLRSAAQRGEGVSPGVDHLLTTRQVGTRSGELSARCYSPHYPDAQLPSPYRGRPAQLFAGLRLAGVGQVVAERVAEPEEAGGHPVEAARQGPVLEHAEQQGFLLDRHCYGSRGADILERLGDAFGAFGPAHLLEQNVAACPREPDVARGGGVGRDLDVFESSAHGGEAT